MFDPSMDGNGDPASKLMKVTMNFNTALGGAIKLSSHDFLKR
jgi:hypothetical protein